MTKALYISFTDYILETTRDPRMKLATIGLSHELIANLSRLQFFVLSQLVVVHMVPVKLSVRVRCDCQFPKTNLLCYLNILFITL